MMDTPKKRSFVLTLIVCLGSFLFGYHSVILGGILERLAVEFSLSTWEKGFLVSFFLMGAFFGAFLGGFLADRVGRKKTLKVSSFLFLLGTAFLCYTHNSFAFFSGRFFVGFAAGMASLTVPLYISEITKAPYQTIFISLNQLAITVGVFFAFLVSFLFCEKHWSVLFQAAWIPEILFFLGLFFILETPSFYRKKEKFEEASGVENFLGFLPSKASETLVEENFGQKKHISLLLLGFGLSVFQQITGINAIMYYIPTLFQNVNASSPLLLSMGVGMWNVLITFLSLWIIWKVNQKKLLLIGLLGMSGSLFLLGASFFMPMGSWVTLFSVLSYLSFFGISLGPLVWVILAKMYPTSIRGKAMGYSVGMNWCANYFVSLTFLPISEFWGMGSTFYFYGGIGVFAFWFVLKKMQKSYDENLLT